MTFRSVSLSVAALSGLLWLGLDASAFAQALPEDSAIEMMAPADAAITRGLDFLAKSQNLTAVFLAVVLAKVLL